MTYSKDFAVHTKTSKTHSTKTAENKLHEKILRFAGSKRHKPSSAHSHNRNQTTRTHTHTHTHTHAPSGKKHTFRHIGHFTAQLQEQTQTFKETLITWPTKRQIRRLQRQIRFDQRKERTDLHPLLWGLEVCVRCVTFARSPDWELSEDFFCKTAYLCASKIDPRDTQIKRVCPCVKRVR